VAKKSHVWDPWFQYKNIENKLHSALKIDELTLTLVSTFQRKKTDKICPNAPEFSAISPTRVEIRRRHQLMFFDQVPVFVSLLHSFLDKQ